VLGRLSIAVIPISSYDALEHAAHRVWTIQTSLSFLILSKRRSNAIGSQKIESKSLKERQHIAIGIVDPALFLAADAHSRYIFIFELKMTERSNLSSVGFMFKN